MPLQKGHMTHHWHILWYLVYVHSRHPSLHWPPDPWVPIHTYLYTYQSTHISLQALLLPTPSLLWQPPGWSRPHFIIGSRSSHAICSLLFQLSLFFSFLIFSLDLLCHSSRISSPGHVQSVPRFLDSELLEQPFQWFSTVPLHHREARLPVLAFPCLLMPLCHTLTPCYDRTHMPSLSAP